MEMALMGKETDPKVKPVLLTDNQIKSLNSIVYLMSDADYHYKNYRLTSALSAIHTLIGHKRHLEDIIKEYNKINNENYDCSVCKATFATKKEVDHHYWQRHER